jgi:DNA invertase Pin-like site-specific DNA recombinase
MRVGVYRDEGVSGSNGVDDRIGLTDALQAVASGNVGGLLVARLDRLARALTVQEAILAKTWALGAAMFAADGGEVMRDDPDDPMRTAMRQMAGVFAELEKNLVKKRLRDGRRAKGEAGGFAYGSPSLGYKAENRELIEDDDEQETLHRIKELLDEQTSLREIARTLTDEGFTPKRSDRWHPETLSRIAIRNGWRKAPAKRP